MSEDTHFFSHLVKRVIEGLSGLWYCLSKVGCQFMPRKGG